MHAAPTRGDAEFAEVLAWLKGRVANPEEFFGQILRRSIDEVLDGPRTGRWDFSQLEKTEKTYVGTKVEIVLRTELGLDPGGFMDLEIEGHPMDVKWAMDSGWQIPREAVDQLCLCLGGRRKLQYFQVGLVRCRADHLNFGSNQDGKKTLSSVGREAMTMLVGEAPTPSNFVADMDSTLRSAVMAEGTIQARVTRLFRELPYTPISRNAIRTIARTEGDPMRRLRADSHAADPLGGMKILSAKYGNRTVEALGHQRLAKDEFMSVPAEDVPRLLLD